VSAVRRRALLSAAALVLARPVPPAPAAVPPQAALDALRALRSELEEVEVVLDRAATLDLAAPPVREVRARLGRGELSRRKAALAAAEALIGEAPLEEWEERTYEDLPPVGAAADGGRTVAIPWGPNEFLCAVFSCFNDPRQGAAVDARLSFKMLEDGLAMAERGDPRVTADGLSQNVADVREKLSLLSATLEERFPTRAR